MFECGFFVAILDLIIWDDSAVLAGKFLLIISQIKQAKILNETGSGLLFKRKIYFCSIDSPNYFPYALLAVATQLISKLPI